MLVALPDGGRWRLCVADGAHPRPLFDIPTEGKARFCLSADGTWLGVLDQDGKRAHLHRITIDGLETALTPQLLAEGDQGCAIATTDGVLYVGGWGKTGEMLWLLRPGPSAEAPGGFHPLRIPKAARRPRKAVDALFVWNNRLLAIDDIVLPKWGFIYDLGAPEAPRLSDVVELPFHTTYERVRAAVLTERGLAVLSAGINHGLQSAHVALLDPDTLRELESSRWTGPEGAKATILDFRHNLLRARSLAVVGGRTLLAGVGPTVWEARTVGALVPGKEGFSQRGGFMRAARPLVPIATTRFAEIHEMPSAGGTGVSVVGTSPDGELGWEFVDVGSEPGEAA